MAHSRNQKPPKKSLFSALAVALGRVGPAEFGRDRVPLRQDRPRRVGQQVAPHRLTHEFEAARPR